MTPGTLKLIQSPTNPNGAEDSKLYLFVGDPSTGPINEVIPQGDFQIPPKKDISSSILKIVHINDLHGHLHSMSDKGYSPKFSRIVSRIRDIRTRHQNDPNTAVLIMSSGDDIVGSLYSELLGNDTDSFSLHAAYQLFSKVGLDVSVLGNHDLDLGSEVLARGIQQDAQFPVLSANLINCQHLKDLARPAALFVVKGIRIGVIGLTTVAQTRQLLHSKLEVIDPIKVVKNLLPALQPLCDIIIILSHLGYRQSDSSVSTPGSRVGDVELAQSLPPGSVNLIVGGHSHDALNKDGLHDENIVNGIPIVQSGAFGEYIGKVDISFTDERATIVNASLTPTEILPVDYQFEEQEVLPLVNHIKNIEKQILGEIEDNPLLGTENVQNGFAKSELALANFITDAMVEKLKQTDTHADFGMIDASALVCGLPFGQGVTFGEWFNVMPYADTIRLYEITGQELFDLIQDNVFRLRRSDKQITERGFLQFSHHIQYSIDFGKTRFEAQAKEIYLNGLTIEEQLDTSFTAVATIFTRELACKWETEYKEQTGKSLMRLQNFPHTKTNIFLRKMLVSYIQEKGGVTQRSGAKLDGRLNIIQEISGQKSVPTELIEGKNS